MQRTGATTLHLARPSQDTAAPGGRLAELVAHLTGCNPVAAMDAVEHAHPSDAQDLSLDDRLAIVAQAIVAVKKEQQLDFTERRERRPA